MKIYYCILAIGFLFLSCSNEIKQGDMLEIQVNIDQDISLILSQITEKLTTVELELTDASVINPDNIIRIVITEDNVVIAEISKILSFNLDGKFVRAIGSRGQGPGEYNYIQNISIDKKNEIMYVITHSPSKIICYDLEGNFIKETFNSCNDINIFDSELLIVKSRRISDTIRGGYYSQSLVYQLDDNLKIIDSCIVSNIYLGNPDNIATLYGSKDYLLNGNGSTYMYYGDFFFKFDNSTERILCDTLYRIEDNQLVPELKLKFKNYNTNEYIYLFNIYRSSRYVFSVYENKLNRNTYYFCYDTKTKKAYNMKDGYTDDINGIDKPITIRPFNHDTEMFYYWHTNMKPDDLEEPNPTLYIGKLKK